ncbi:MULTISPECIES: isocitrate lyase/PEP mutase family protein [Pandoraea]|uniref:isocitrate lyase/PEP mutase family protein n=1 Tax=Pandoraea TaxID=93217 RepID=UPI001F5DEEC4|nr:MULTISPECIES: isocitrate lyase/PEP mutase family protein [Pandoraea]
MLNEKRKSLRALLDSGQFIVAPAIHDAYAAKIVQTAGFPSACTSGAVLSHALLGLPDVAVLSVTENVEHCRRLARVIDIPLTADADAGYGNPFNVFHTIRLFEEAGLAGVNLEDQVTPRRWGSGSGAEVVAVREMVRKIEAACEARRDDDFILIVRTDALPVEGIDATRARIAEYIAAGADVILPMGTIDDAQIASLVDTARDVPISISVSTQHPLRASTTLRESIERLRGLGVRRISLPQWLPSAAAKAMADVCETLASLGVTRDTPTHADEGGFPAGRFATPAALREWLDADAVERQESVLLRA